MSLWFLVTVSGASSEPETRNQKPQTSFLGRSSFLGPLRAVFRATLLSSLDANCVQSSTNHVITNTRQILNSTSADQDDRVLLQVVTDTRDIRRDLYTVGQTNASYFSQSRVGFLRGLCVHSCTHATLLRARIQCRARGLVFNVDSSLPN